MNRLAGCRAVVLGGGRGIGAAIARAYGAEGAAVMIAARSLQDLDGVRDEITASRGRAVALHADVRDESSLSHLADAAATLLGGPVDVLVNSAGLYQPHSFADYTIDDWTKLFDVNVIGTVRAIRAFLPSMLDAGKGRIVNIASTAGKYGTANQSAYNASKHAVLGLTRSLALEVAARGIRINAICPGWVDTGLLQPDLLAPVLAVEPGDVPATLASRVPIGRLVRPEEVAALAVYLATPEADAMTGVGLTLAGGLILI